MKGEPPVKKKQDQGSGKPEAGKAGNPRLFAKVLQAILETHRIPTGSSEQVAEALGQKLGRLATVELELATQTQEVTRLREVIASQQNKLADMLAVAQQTQSSAVMFQQRGGDLLEKNADRAKLIKTLIRDRDVLLGGGTDAENLRATLESVGSTAAPDGLDKPEQELLMDDHIELPPITGDTKPIQAETFAALQRRVQQPVPDVSHHGHAVSAGLFDFLETIGVLDVLAGRDRIDGLRRAMMGRESVQQ